MASRDRNRSSMFGLILTLALAAAGPVPAFAQEAHQFEIAARDAVHAIHEFGSQSGTQILASAEQLTGKNLNDVAGTHTTDGALRILLAGTGLAHRYVGERTIALVQADAGPGGSSQAKASGPSPASDASDSSARGSDEGTRVSGNVLDPASSYESQDLPAPEETRKGIPEILVRGSRILNMDIRRSRDDAQPYVIFEKEAIAASAATNLEDFLKTRLTMNTQGGSSSQSPSTAGATSGLNLRGLGTGQTLILIDGRRALGGLGELTSPAQADLNGIPLAAIERVEVLPATASGIYGGAATGGVINVVLRRDYEGAELKTTYQGTFASDASLLQASLSGGFNLEDGKSNVLVSASWSERSGLATQDRDFMVDGRARVLANNPNFYLNSATPPLGYTPNIRSVSGAPLFGAGTPNITFIPEGYAGNGGLAPLQANAGRYNFSLAQSAQLQDGGAGGRFALLNAPETYSIGLTGRRQHSQNFETYVEVAQSANAGQFFTNNFTGTYTVAATAPNNPFGQDIRVRVPVTQADGFLEVETRNRRAVVGLVAEIPKEWQASADVSWQEFSFESSTPPFSTGAETALISSGAIDVLRDLNRYPIDLSPYFGPNKLAERKSTMKIGTMRASGPIGELPGGTPVVSGLVEYRRDDFGDTRQYFLSSVFYRPSMHQEVQSAYLEARLPIVSSGQAVPFLRQLELQLAGRWDRYEVNGATAFAPDGAPIVRRSNRNDSINPTLGLRLAPTESVLLRASYGTGFLPPNVSQLAPGIPQGTSSTTGDPRRGNTPVGAFTATFGGNAGLLPEESESWSAGIVFTPKAIPELRLSIDWTRIDKTDNIVSPTVALLLDNEALFPQRIVRGANLPGDQPGWAGPISSLDLTAANLSSGEVEAWDVALDYSLETAGAGAFSAHASATWHTHFITQVAPSTVPVENAGISSSNPLKLKANAGLTWRFRQWSVGWAAQYFDSYQVAANPSTTGATAIANHGGLFVEAQTYHDAFASYRWEDEDTGSPRWLSNTEVRGAVRNLFDTAPPFDAGVTTAFYSRFGDPREAVYEISLKKNF